MEKDKILSELEDKNKELHLTKSEYSDVMFEYMDKVKQYESMKLKFLDTTVRDSVEKQIIRACQEDEKFASVVEKVDELKIRSTILMNKLSIIKEEITVLKLILENS